ncbi:MAG TPA: DUF2480 family protein [Chitinophagales bacterium]|nr:DUF2480 family protein [Chitinophagales bacterium]
MSTNPLPNPSSEQPIVNRVAQSQVLRLVDLEEFFPKEEIVGFDLQPHLFHGLILKEKEFREAMRTHDWDPYAGKAVFIHCSADTIIPVWAYMLVASYLKDKSTFVMLGSKEQLIERMMVDNVKQLDVEQFKGKKVLVKGCSDKPVPFGMYVEVARLLLPVVSSLMYGEACSNVPVFKTAKPT